MLKIISIAFKCSNEAGMFENIEGKILDSKGSGTFKSIHDGMGVFGYCLNWDRNIYGRMYINYWLNFSANLLLKAKV
jgi:hypothetical protein